jgi:hypothetical protein
MTSLGQLAPLVPAGWRCPPIAYTQTRPAPYRARLLACKEFKQTMGSKKLID